MFRVPALDGTCPGPREEPRIGAQMAAIRRRCMDCRKDALPGASRCAVHSAGEGWSAYKQRHPDRQRYYASSTWRRRRRAHLDAQPTYVRCGAAATQADHIIAVALGGDLKNGPLQSMCERCHRDKTVRDSHQAAKRAADRRRKS